MERISGLWDRAVLLEHVAGIQLDLAQKIRSIAERWDKAEAEMDNATQADLREEAGKASDAARDAMEKAQKAFQEW
jgi:hypothetical protein